MDGEKSKEGKKGGKKQGLSAADTELWQAMVKDVKPLAKKRVKAADSNSLQDKVPVVSARPHTDIITAPSIAAKGREVDGKLQQKLNRGQYKIDEVIDLHGLSAARAQKRAVEFVRHAIARNMRAVLIVTGKGRVQGDKMWFDAQPGIINRSLAEWLMVADLAPHILKIQKAARHQGGDGAYVVLLRRKR